MIRPVRAYLELLRPANVVTALADVLAGFAISGMQNRAALPWLLASTACLYGGGVVLNDVFDRDLDRIERPERPIPSGRVSVQGAAMFGGILLASGIGLATAASATAAALAAAIAGCVLLYDAWGKRRRLSLPTVQYFFVLVKHRAEATADIPMRRYECSSFWLTRTALFVERMVVFLLTLASSFLQAALM